MKIGIMQPYFMPYIGYWQLIHAVDKFVILDDVNYIMRGYINRNSILLNGKPYRFTIPVEKASQNKLILETKLSFTSDEKGNFLQTISNAYRKAPYYEAVMPIIEDIVNYQETDLTAFIRYSIETIMEYLGIQTEILVSSAIEKDQNLKGEKRILEICKKLGADIYINPCGGRSLYHREVFAKKKIQLFFLETQSNHIIYEQVNQEFTENLSIIDILMFNCEEEIQDFLQRYELTD